MAEDKKASNNNNPTLFAPPSFSLGEDYSIPTWSSKANHAYFLEVIKNGVPFEERDISYKPFILLGKYPDLCDIVLEHPTISRKHAVIQHKNNGEIYIYDLGSSHGTFVNNKRLPSRVYHRLSPFDSIKFAASTRIHILRCIALEEKETEEELSKEIITKGVAKNQGQEQIQPKEGCKEVLGDGRIRTPKELKEVYVKLRENDPYFRMQNKTHKLTGGPEGQQKNSEGIQWGISDEQEVYSYQDENQIALIPELLRRLPNLSEKQVEKIDRYEERLNKYRGSEQEMQQLNTKEQKEFGLEDRLKVRKDNLMAKMLETQALLDSAEQAVRLSLFADTEETDESRKKRTFSKFEASNNFDEDDDFFDRTKKQVKVEPDERKKAILARIEINTESYWGLKQKLEKLLYERHDLNQLVISAKVGGTSEGDEKAGDSDDELDAFMQETKEKLAKEKIEKLFIQIRELEKEIKMVSEMLQYIKPDAEMDFEGFEKSLATPKSVVGFSNDNDDDDEMSLIPRASIVKEAGQKKNDNLSVELAKLKEIKQRRIDEEKKRKNKAPVEVNEDIMMSQVNAELNRQKKQEKNQFQAKFAQYKVEFANDGDDAPLFVETKEQNAAPKRVYAATSKPVDRNVKNTRQQEVCVDLTYMEVIEKSTDSYNNIMGEKFGY